MKKIIILTIVCLISGFAIAQDSERFYATMALHDATELKQDLPDEVTIISSRGNEAAVQLTENAGHVLHDRVLMHGPGYIFKTSEAEAIAALYSVKRRPNANRLAFTITEDLLVNETIDLINTQNIEDHILELEAYGTRYHNRPAAVQAANDLKTKWEDMATLYGRTDVTVRLFNHSNTNMPSVIMTIEGADFPDEFVIVGGHLDSTSNQGNNNAPGADDDASGIATITEATRALFEVGFVPQRTIEVMAYAAEEIGLVGSAEIAQQYNTNNVNVTAVVQFDMTNYNGSANDISFITDFTDGTLNSFLMSLVDHYNASGSHQFTYGTSLCNYGCSDHASWDGEGYMAAFPFEANFGQHNNQIHTANDTYSLSGTSEHATKFSKLCAEFLIETAKSEEILGLDDSVVDGVGISVRNGVLTYSFVGTSEIFNRVSIYDIQGKKIMEELITGKTGTISLDQLASGAYIASFVTNTNQLVSKKIILE